MELTIDTASPAAGVAISEQGRLVAEYTWNAGRRHAAELLPAIERVMRAAKVVPQEIEAVFIDRGPGGYAGLRVGVSTGMAIAFAADAEVLGYGRLAADAYPLLALGRPVCAVHDAGRGECAWAVYQQRDGSVHEIEPPQLATPDSLIMSIPPDAIVAGEVNELLAERIRGAHPAADIVAQPGLIRRAATGAALAWPRFAAGERDSRLALTPLYLREPNITTRRAPPEGAPHADGANVDPGQAGRDAARPRR